MPETIEFLLLVVIFFLISLIPIFIIGILTDVMFEKPALSQPAGVIVAIVWATICSYMVAFGGAV